MLWLIILVVLAVLVGGGIYARNRQLARSRPASARWSRPPVVSP